MRWFYAEALYKADFAGPAGLWQKKRCRKLCSLMNLFVCAANLRLALHLDSKLASVARPLEKKLGVLFL